MLSCLGPPVDGSSHSLPSPGVFCALGRVSLQRSAQHAVAATVGTTLGTDPRAFVVTTVMSSSIAGTTDIESPAGRTSGGAVSVCTADAGAVT